MFLSPTLLQSNLKGLMSTLAFPMPPLLILLHLRWESPCCRQTRLHACSYSTAQMYFFFHLFAKKKLKQQENGGVGVAQDGFCHFLQK